jgi:hypothetical protein
MLFGFTLAICIWEWYATGNSFRGTPRGGRKKPIAGRSPTGRLSTAAMCRDLEKNGMVEQDMGAAWQVWIKYGRTVYIKWEKHILNPSATAWQGNGMGAACYVWIGLKSSDVDSRIPLGHRSVTLLIPVLRHGKPNPEMQKKK